MSAGRSPFDEFERLFDRMSRQFERSSRGRGAMEPYQGSQGIGSMDVDLVDQADEFVATADLPGYDAEDVTIQVTDRTLRIDAEREATAEEAGDHYVRRERSHRSVHRSIQLPDEVDRENVTAELNNGVATVTLPKREPDAARRIDIE